MSYEKEYVKVFWDADTEAVHLVWKGFVNGEQLRDGLEAGLRLVQAHGAKRWVGDCKLLGPLGKADQQWVNTDWFPRLLGTGLERMAVIVPQKMIASMAVESIMQEIEGTALVTCHFGDYAEGCTWVRSVQAA